MLGTKIVSRNVAHQTRPIRIRSISHRSRATGFRRVKFDRFERSRSTLKRLRPSNGTHGRTNRLRVRACASTRERTYRENGRNPRKSRYGLAFEERQILHFSTQCAIYFRTIATVDRLFRSREPRTEYAYSCARVPRRFGRDPRKSRYGLAFEERQILHFSTQCAIYFRTIATVDRLFRSREPRTEYAYSRARVPRQFGRDPRKSRYGLSEEEIFHFSKFAIYFRTITTVDQLFRSREPRTEYVYSFAYPIVVLWRMLLIIVGHRSAYRVFTKM